MSRSKAAAAATKQARPQATHPSWIEMIKACITAHPDHARQGVSRPQIKKFVEQTYKLEMTTQQNVMLSRALGSGSDRGVFVLPKGPSGRVKLAPKTKIDSSAKENKPTKPKAAAPKTAATKPSVKPTAKTGKTVPKSTKPAPRRQASKSTTARPTTTATGRKAAVGRPKSTTVVKKTAATTKKPQAAKPKSSTTMRKSSIQRGAAKRSVTGETATAKAKAAGKRAPAKASSSKTARKATGGKTTPRKKPAKRS